MVSGQSTGSPSEPTEVDRAASAACIRSGTFALLVCVALFLLVPYWKNAANYAALGKYVFHRLNLADALDSLDENILWQKYKETHEAAESMSIGQLANARVDLASGTGSVATPPPKQHVKQTHHLSTKKEAQHAVAPGAQPQAQTGFVGKVGKPSGTPHGPPPPTSMTAKLVWEEGVGWELPRIVDALKGLNDPETLGRSRQVSNFFENSIVRWVNKRNTLLYRNVVTTHCTTKELEVPVTGNKPTKFVPALTEEALLQCLTLRDVRALAQAELPTMSNPIQLGGRTGEPIDVTLGALPREPFMASLVAQGLLFFLILYFAAFAQEAVLSPQFPAPGTLFGAFTRSWWTRLLLLLALWSPFVASAVVAGYSHKPALWGGAALVGAAVVAVHLVLQRKSYFGGWRLP